MTERLRVGRAIRRGGVAELREAFIVGEGGFERRVAIKQLLSHHERDEAMRRAFIDEARIASRLHHPNIVAIFDFGERDGRPFQTLEFVDGLDLDALAARAEFPRSVALHIVLEVLRALEHAHAACSEDGEELAVVHRDVSPGNVLVSWDGNVKLADFGIAHARGRLQETSIGVRKGTLSFMSPEQAVQDGVDARTDVYAVGCLLHWMFVHASPLDEPGALARHIDGAPLALSPQLEPELASIVRRAVQRNPNDRYPSAAAMSDAMWPIYSRASVGDTRREVRQWMSTIERVHRPDSIPAAGVEELFDASIFAEQDSTDPPGNRVSGDRTDVLSTPMLQESAQTDRAATPVPSTADQTSPLGVLAPTAPTAPTAPRIAQVGMRDVTSEDAVVPIAFPDGTARVEGRSVSTIPSPPLEPPQVIDSTDQQTTNARGHLHDANSADTDLSLPSVESATTVDPASPPGVHLPSPPPRTASNAEAHEAAPSIWEDPPPKIRYIWGVVVIAVVVVAAAITAALLR